MLKSWIFWIMAGFLMVEIGLAARPLPQETMIEFVSNLSRLLSKADHNIKNEIIRLKRNIEDVSAAITSLESAQKVMPSLEYFGAEVQSIRQLADIIETRKTEYKSVLSMLHRRIYHLRSQQNLLAHANKSVITAYEKLDNERSSYVKSYFSKIININNYSIGSF